VGFKFKLTLKLALDGLSHTIHAFLELDRHYFPTHKIDILAENSPLVSE
jgi:hypothetical protein